LSEGVFPICMELLPARDATGIQVSLEMVDRTEAKQPGIVSPMSVCNSEG
jgi:hypothetical protein